MIYILFSLLFFIFTIAVQILTHRVLLRFGKRTFATIHIITFGCLVNAIVQHSLFRTLSSIPNDGNIWFLPVPISASVFYILLYFFYITYSASPYLGQEGPTSRILLLFRKHQVLTEKQIIDAFTEKETVLDRIADLTRSGWAIEQGRFLQLMPFGKILARGILFYRNVLGIRSGG